MQTSDLHARLVSAFALTISIVAGLTACSSSDSDSSDTTGADNSADASGSSGGSGSSNTSNVGDGNSSSGGTAASAGGSSSTTASASGGSAGAGPGCAVEIASHDLDAAIHVTECSHIDYATNPPSSGQHYGVWAAYQTYDFPVPRGYWVHSLEHGAVVISYNCPEGCPDEVAEAESLIASLPVDPRCVPYDLDRQVILTPDPHLDTRWAMSSWGHTLRADCIDAAAFADFYESNVAHGPEDICGGGSALTEATLAPDCGE